MFLSEGRRSWVTYQLHCPSLATLGAPDQILGRNINTLKPSSSGSGSFLRDLWPHHDYRVEEQCLSSFSQARAVSASVLGRSDQAQILVSPGMSNDPRLLMSERRFWLIQKQ